MKAYMKTINKECPMKTHNWRSHTILLEKKESNFRMEQVIEPGPKPWWKIMSVFMKEK